jgi:hypothetical protein
MSLHDEAAFLFLWAAQPWDEPVPSEWVLYMGNDPNPGPVGWTLSFDVTRDEGAWEVDVTLDAVAQAPPLLDESYTDVVEVSASGVVELMEDSWYPHTVTETPEGQWLRLRLSRKQSDRSRPKLLVQAWPADPGPAAVLRVMEEPPPDLWQVQLPEAQAGLAGAARIGADVDGAPGRRTLSGELGTATATVTIRERMSWLTNLFEAGLIWTPALDGYSAENRLYTDPAGEYWEACFVKDATHPDHIAGTTLSAILTRRRDEHDPPRLSALWWQWGKPVPPLHRTLGTPRDYEPFLGTDAQVDVRYERNRDKSITVSLAHSGIPAEWVDDLSAWWTYQLAILRRVADRRARRSDKRSTH